MKTSRSGGRRVPQTRKSLSASESLSIASAIADLREQTLLVVALLDQADKAAKEGRTKTARELIAKGHEAAKGARDRARALDEQVAPHTRRKS